MHSLLIAAAGFVLGAFGRRVVGGVLGDDWHVWKVPHLLACIWLGLCMGAAAALGMLSLLLGAPILDTPWWAPVAIGTGAVLGHVVFGLWNSAGMGHYGDHNELWKFWGYGTWTSPVPQPAETYAKIQGTVAPPIVLLRTRRKPGFALCWLGMTAYGLQLVALGVVAAFCPLVHGVWLAALLGGLAVAPIYALAWLVWPHLPIWPGVTGNPLELAEWLAGGAIGTGLALIG